ncbi:MAG: sugar phosphate isomerase/epimerase [Acidobacteria bacterium]|nr:sugar phosphate isomerase/epimerase [Acidobacteriota bacterium]
MDHVLSTHLFVNHRLTTVWLERIRRADIPAVEVFCARQHLDYRDRAQVRELGHWFADSQLRLHSLHSPMYNDDCWGKTGPNAVITLTEPVKAKRVAMVDEIKRAIEVAETVPFRYLIQHIGVGAEEFDERKLDAAFTCLEELSLFARQRGVEILLENIPNALSSAERLLYFLEITHMELGFVFDTGHANIMEGVKTAWDLMKHRVRSLHVHDNDGKSDTHLFPMLAEGGTIDWRETMALFRACPPGQFPLLLELKEAPGVTNPIERACEVFEKLEAIRAED